MTITLTKQQVREMNPPARDFRAMRDNLPGGDTTPYTPSAMAARGVPHRTIVWAFLRPEVLGSGFGAVVCRIADEVLPVFEDTYPDDTRPRAAIEAARVCFASPTPENKAVAFRAARVAFRASWESVGFAVARAADVAGDAARCASGDAGPGRVERADWADWAEWAAVYAEWAAKEAVEAGCPPATVIRLIEGAGQ